jgi:hypothetical protein
MSKISLKTPGDIPAVVNHFLGFTPTDSLVILGVAGGPSARVDISAEGLDASVNALRPAAEHWTSGIVVVLYSEEVDLLDVANAMTHHMPNVPIMVMVEVDQTYGRTLVIDSEGNVYVPTTVNMPAEVLAKRTVASRDDLVSEAAEINDSDTAWILAREAYRIGDGARAWVYLDRFHALHAPTDDSTMLADFLTRVVNPRGDEARELLG